MKKTLIKLGAATVLTVAAVASASAAPATTVNVVQNININLTAYSQGATNAAGTKVSIDTSKINTATILADLKSIGEVANPTRLVLVKQYTEYETYTIYTNGKVWQTLPGVPASVAPTNVYYSVYTNIGNPVTIGGIKYSAKVTSASWSSTGGGSDIEVMSGTGANATFTAVTNFTSVDFGAQVIAQTGKDLNTNNPVVATQTQLRIEELIGTITNSTATSTNLTFDLYGLQTETQVPDLVAGSRAAIDLNNTSWSVTGHANSSVSTNAPKTSIVTGTISTSFLENIPTTNIVVE